MTKMRLDPLLF